MFLSAGTLKSAGLLPGMSVTLFDPLLLTRRLGYPPGTFCTTVATGPEPSTENRTAGSKLIFPSLRLVEQDRDVVGALVGDQQVGLAVEVGDGDADRVGADEEALCRR